jgi:flavodoxin
MTAPSLTIVYSSFSGHTEHVIDTIEAFIKKSLPALVIRRIRAEQATAEDLEKADALLFGSGTWNTGGAEGRLNPYMNELLEDKAKDIKLTGKPMAFVSLGDDRYYYTARCTEGFLRFLRESGGKQILPPLIVVNEPYGQEERVTRWAEKLVAGLK